MRRRAEHLAAPAADVPADDSDSHAHRPISAPRSLLMRVLCLPFPAWPMALIWALVGANWLVHNWLREELWDVPVLLGGHAILALQLASFARVVYTHPGSPSAEWQAAAYAGHEPVELSKGVPVPPRARYVRRRGETVLAFDHHCWWLGVPIGWRNRKFFVQFVLYSSLLSAFALCLTYADVQRLVPGFVWAMPSSAKQVGPDSSAAETIVGALGTPASPRGQHGSRSLQQQPFLYMLLVPSPVYWITTVVMFSELSREDLVYTITLLVLVAFNIVACILLGGFGVWHLRLARRNRTSLSPACEEQYDVGSAANLRQVFGSQRWLWALPLWLGDAPRGDGIHWPRNELAHSPAALEGSAGAEAAAGSPCEQCERHGTAKEHGGQACQREPTVR